MIGFHTNTRFLRFLIVLSAVILTIFIYASYSSNGALAPPHMRGAGPSSAATLAASLRSQQLVGNRSVGAFKYRFHSNATGISDTSSGSGSGSYPSAQIAVPTGWHNKKNKKAAAAPAPAPANAVVPKKPHHREPTIDVDAVNDVLVDVPDEAALDRFVGNDLLEEQYGQNFDGMIGGNINNTIVAIGALQQQQQGEEQLQNAGGEQLSRSQHEQEKQELPHSKTQSQEQQQRRQLDKLADNIDLNKVADSEVMIPTSNLQKLIENADKILKNITALPVIPSKSSSKDNALALKPQKVISEDVSSDDDVALPPSVVMTIKYNNAKISAAAMASKPSKIVTKSNTTAVQKKDPTHGILAKQIYESGHMNEELNIPKLCPNSGADLKLLILITSAQAHTEARMAIRQTWAHYGTRRDVSTAFILGRTANETLSAALSQENFIYGDLIRGNFLDSYNNLTLKTISALEWVDQHCPLVNHVLKTDDDMFINVPKLLAFLDNHSKDKRVIYGRLAKKWKPIRNMKSKYYVSTDQFSSPVFPPFTTGPAYVISRDIVHDLYERSLHQVYLKLEDVFTTGIVAQQLGIRRVHVNEFLNRRIAFNPCNIRKTISVHMIKSNEQFDLWKKLLDQTTKCK